MSRNLSNKASEAQGCTKHMLKAQEQIHKNSGEKKKEHTLRIQNKNNQTQKQLNHNVERKEL